MPPHRITGPPSEFGLSPAPLDSQELLLAPKAAVDGTIFATAVSDSILHVPIALRENEVTVVGLS